MKNSIIMVLVIVVIASVSKASANIPPEPYLLKGNEPIGPGQWTIDATAPIPFNKGYAELTEDQQNRFKVGYPALLPGESPPFPKHGLESVYAPIIDDQRSMLKRGSLSVAVMVDEWGAVDSLVINQSPGKRLTQHVANVIRTVEFDPATCQGAPCKMAFMLKLELK